MLRIFCYVVVVLIASNGINCKVEKHQRDEIRPTQIPKDPLKALNQSSQVKEDIKEPTSINQTNEKKDVEINDTMTGFIKLYNFALNNGKVNLTETLKNLTKLNGTIPTNITSKLFTNSTAIKLPATNSGSFVKKPSSEAATDLGGSGDEDKEDNHSKDAKEDHVDFDDDDEDDDDNEKHYKDGDNEYSYHDQYYGGNGGGYEYNTNNGVTNGQGYNYNYDSTPDGTPTMEGQGYEYKNFPNDGYDTPYPQDTGNIMGSDDESTPMGMNQGFVNYDDTNSPQYLNPPARNYAKKTHTHHKVKKHAKPLNRHIKHKKNLHILHRQAAKKLVTTKKHQTDWKVYRRTIMIGNRVCGSKKSTNINTRDAIRPYSDEQDDDIAKRDTKETEQKQHVEGPLSIHATDACCADHYECPRVVPAKATKFGYTNDIEYDVMACQCDAKFRNCLKNANSYTADAVGHLYFNTLKIPCLTFEKETAETKSEQPQPPQDSSNVVSVVPDATTERETVGGAQLVISPNIANNMNDHTKDSETERDNHHQQDSSQPEHQKLALHVKDSKKDDDDSDPVEKKRKIKQVIINPNPSPNNPNLYNTKLRGMVTIPEAYSPKLRITQ